MKQIVNFIFMTLCISSFLHSVQCDYSVSTFIQEVRNDFRSIEMGETSTLAARARIEINKRMFDIAYYYGTRYVTHKQWTSRMEITEISKNSTGEPSIVKQIVDKSLFTDGKLYRNTKFSDPDLLLLENLATKGPKIYSYFDEMITKQGQELTFKRDQYVHYQKEFDLMSRRMYIIVNKVDQGPYRFKYYDKHGMSISVINIHMKIHESLSDNIFKITDDLKYEWSYDSILRSLDNGLLLGMWGLLKD